MIIPELKIAQLRLYIYCVNMPVATYLGQSNLYFIPESMNGYLRSWGAYLFTLYKQKSQKSMHSGDFSCLTANFLSY